MRISVSIMAVDIVTICLTSGHPPESWVALFIWALQLSGGQLTACGLLSNGIVRAGDPRRAVQPGSRA